MNLGKNQFLIKILGNEATIIYRNHDISIKNFLLILDDEKRTMFSSQSNFESVDEEPYVAIVADKKRVKFVTTKTETGKLMPVQFKGAFTLIYTDNEHFGYFVIHATYCDEDCVYESVQTYMDFMDQSKFMYLTEKILKTYFEINGEKALPDTKELAKLF